MVWLGALIIYVLYIYIYHITMVVVGHVVLK